MAAEMADNVPPPESLSAATPPAQDAQDVLAGRQIDTRGRSLRAHAARGTIVNSVFQIGIAGIGFINRIAVAAFLTTTELGTWGLILMTLVTLSWLKQIGIADKYIQQSEPDQELAYQKAFTLEFLLSLAFFALLVVAMPLYALIYDAPEIVVPGIVLATVVPISAFETPVWIFHRRMEYVRQRTLSAVDPIVSVIVTVTLGALGAGYWCLIAGVLAGSVAGSVVSTIASPYPFRLRFERGTLREYARFSWPLLGYQMSTLAVVQGTMIVASRTVGIAGVGVITLVGAVTQLSERLDTIVSETLYPAICAVADRRDLLFESFLKSNRLALMWGMPFGVGLALFADDLVHFLLGDRWAPAIGLLAAVGLIAGFRQIAYNWQIFMRAVNRTRPIFIGSIVNLGSFLVMIVPLMIAFGLTGYAIGFAAATLVQLAVRGYFLRRLFPGFRTARQFFRSIAPSVPAAGVILLLRLLVDGGRTPARAIGEIALYIAVTVVATYWFERRLLQEMGGYLRGKGFVRAKLDTPPAATPSSPTPAQS
jgi:O-antigen/teichoic acid export membrane protein